MKNLRGSKKFYKWEGSSKIKLQMRNSSLFLCFCASMEIAICLPAYAPMKAGTAHQSEQLSQLLSGEPVRLLENAGDWSLIETEHRYQGYVRSAHLKRVSAKFPEKFMGFVDSGCLSENSIFDGFPAFQWREENSRTLAVNVAGEIQYGKSISELAMRFLGVPYVWGGKTPAGLDCSGLVQLVFNLAGYSFPRDAWQQAEAGIEISFDASDPMLEPGDLLFFSHPGKRIHHVGISLGATEFVHASEWVRVQSLSAGHPHFAPDRLETLSLVKRPDFSSLTEMKTAVKNLFSGY